eukprot:gene45845-57139_t
MGEVVDGYPHGFGKLFLTTTSPQQRDMVSYEGNFTSGRVEGDGFATYADKSVYR